MARITRNQNGYQIANRSIMVDTTSAESAELVAHYMDRGADLTVIKALLD